MKEYDRWYRDYQRRRRIAQIAGTVGLGFMVIGVGTLLWVLLSVVIVVFGTPPAPTPL